MNTYKCLEDINHPILNGLVEATKIQYFVDKTRPQANLELILAVVYNNESLENDFSSFVNFVRSEVVRTKTRRKSHDYGNKENVSKFQTSNNS